MAKDSDGLPSGMVRLKHGSATVCSFGGRQYRADQNGHVTVPAGAIEPLGAHGFAVVEGPATGKDGET
ncbi:MAG: hypothetical protein JO267_07065 [Alphaproteobacteria bacterium]|nr:hypothetical protein [Alphaproteobacteria bacterium]